jgi:hypothetical protein
MAAAVAQGGQHHQDRRLLLLQAGLHVHAVHPQVDDVKVGDRPHPPQVVLCLPARLQPRDRRGRQRRSLAQQSAQGQIEVAQGQAVQVQLRQQPTYFLRPALECRQQPALKPLTQAPHPRALHGDRSVTQAQPPRPPEPVAIPWGHIDGTAPFVPAPAQELIDFFFQHPLQEALHPLPCERLQRLPFGP